MIKTITCLFLGYVLFTSHMARADLVLSASPTETPEEGASIFEPLARYLSDVLGERVSYQHAGTAAKYHADLRQDKYDLVFDDAHFSAWRMKRFSHTPLIRLDDDVSYTVVAHQKNARISRLTDIAGRRLCATPPPALATLTVIRQFNPSRLPYIKASHSYQESLDRVIKGSCVATVVDSVFLAKYDKSRELKALFRSKSIPGMTLTAGKRLDVEQRNKIRTAFVANKSLKPLLNRYSHTGKLQAAAIPDYQGMEYYLDSVWGFTLQTANTSRY